MKIGTATAYGLALILGIAGGHNAAIAATLSHGAVLTAFSERGTLLTAENTLSFSVDNIEIESGKDALFTIKLPSPAELQDAGAAEGTFLLIRNIPEGVRVSAGMATGRIWVVPLREANGLRLISKPGMSTGFQLGFHLIGPGNRILAETTVSVDLRQRKTIQTVAVASSPQVEAPKAETPKQPVQPSKQEAALSSQEEAIMLARGKQVLQQGGIVGARLIFEELATRGSAAGALALARSYDPAYVAQSAASAPSPNIGEALKWYERAAELGNPDAKRRLAEIGPGR